MKNLKYILASFIFLSPLVTFGATYITPSTIYTDTVINCNVDNSSIGYSTIAFIDDVFVWGDTCPDNSTGVFSSIFGGDFSEMLGIDTILVVNADDINYTDDCENGDYDTCINSTAFVSVLGTNYQFINSSTPVATGLFHTRNISGDISSSPSDLVASVGVVSMGVYGSVLPYMYVVIGIGVAFYILQRLLEIMPKEKKSKMKRYDIVGESSGGVVHTTFRERKKDL